MAKSLVEKLGRNADVSTTTALETALDRAQFVVTAVEVGRSLYWAQDYYIPRKYGFRQVFAENGGPGSLFHGLRAMKAMVPIARAMERICPDAILLNYTNPRAPLPRPDEMRSHRCGGTVQSRQHASS
jgi:alpha-galactosidase